MPALNLALPCAQTTPAPKAATSSADKAQPNASEGAQPQGFAEQLDARVKGAQSKDSSPEAKAQGQTQSDQAQPSDQAKPTDQAEPADPAQSPDAAAAAAAALAALLGTPAQTATPGDSAQGTPAATTPVASATTDPAVMMAQPATDGAQTAASQAIAAGTAPNAAALAAATAKPATPQATAASGEGKNSDARSTQQLGQPVAREALTAAATPVTKEIAELGAKPLAARTTEQGTGELSSAQTNPAQNFAEQLNARTAHLARSEAPQIPVRTQAAQPGWAEEVGNRISWMASKDMGKAELVLTPAHLGRVEISLSVDGDKASAAFVAATPAAREALEQSIPRLREVLSQSGLNLGQVNVSANNANSQGRQDNRGGESRSRTTASSAVGGVSVGVMSSRIREANGLVDTFA